MPPCPLKPLSRKPPMRPVLSLLSVLWLLASPAHAQCIGENLIAALPAAQQETLRAKAESAPFATGNFWRARKGEQVIHLIGTYHFDDPRHAPLLAALAPVLDQATTLLVEAGPEEEAAIKAYVAKHPEVMIDPATANGTPVQALEPFDTLFTLFDAMPPEDQLAMVTSALAMEDRSADFAVTLADSYFAEEGRLLWEFMRYETLLLPDYTPERVQTEFAMMETALMIRRNRAWIPVITAAAARGPVLVGFGALHLSGEAGVLNLLAQDGYSLERLPLK